MLHVTPLKTPEKQNFFDFFSKNQKGALRKNGLGFRRQEQFQCDFTLFIF